VNMSSKKVIALTMVMVCSLVGCTPFAHIEDNGAHATVPGPVSEAVDDNIQEDLSPTEEELIERQVEEWMETHSLEEKVAQMFMVTPDKLTGYSNVTAAGSVTEESIREYPVGGLIYFKENLENPDQTKEMLDNTKKYYQEQDTIMPFLATDEEGGLVSRIGNNSNFDLSNVGDMRDIGDTGDPQNAAQIGDTLGAYLAEIGFNMDMAPDADVLTNPQNEIIGNRSFGTDADLVAKMATAEASSMRQYGVLPVYKHFPGHGATVGDTHDGFVSIDQTLEELYEDELVPFQEAISQDAEVIMVGHISVPNITGSNEPSSLSHYMITDVLRGQMGYEGVVITDAMNMGAIADNYSSADMAVQAVNAGVDIILMPVNFQKAYQAVLDAVKSGDVPEARIDESVRRILRVKYKLPE